MSAHEPSSTKLNLLRIFIFLCVGVGIAALLTTSRSSNGTGVQSREAIQKLLNSDMKKGQVSRSTTADHPVDCLYILEDAAKKITSWESVQRHIHIFADAVFSLIDDKEETSRSLKDSLIRISTRMDISAIKGLHKFELQDEGNMIFVFGNNLAISADLDENKRCRITGLYEPTKEGKLNPSIVSQIKHRPQQDIYNGHDTSDTKTFPFAAAVTEKVDLNNGAGAPRCSAVILMQRWILSTSDCLVGQISNRHIVAGASPFSQSANRQIVDIEKVYALSSHGIALAHLRSSLTFNEYVNQVPRIMTYRPADESCLTLVGYGRHDPTVVAPYDRPQRWTPMNLKSDSWCEANSKVSDYEAGIEICGVGNPGHSCAGDDGGPVVYSAESALNLLAMNSRSVTVCNTETDVDVFEGMPYHYKWISEQIASMNGYGPRLLYANGTCGTYTYTSSQEYVLKSVSC